jgi:hypothetical protein
MVVDPKQPCDTTPRGRIGQPQLPYLSCLSIDPKLDERFIILELTTRQLLHKRAVDQPDYVERRVVIDRLFPSELQVLGCRQQGR